MTKSTKTNLDTIYCSFCGKSQHEVRKLVAGPTVFVCDECVELCDDIIWESNSDRVMIKVRLPVTAPYDEMLFDTMTDLLRERFPDLDFKYECKTTHLSDLKNKSETTAVFSALKIYGDDRSGSKNSIKVASEAYTRLREELSTVLTQLSVANTKFNHENKRSQAIQRELEQLKIEYLDHLRETSKALSKSDTSLKVVLFLDISGFSLLDKRGRERLLDMLRGMIPVLLEGTDASDINMWGDAIVATFTEVDHALESAIRFVRHLEVDRMGVRIGMAWGEVRTNFNPATGRRDIDGDAVNRAARMEPLAPTGGILAAEEFGGLDINPALAELIPIEIEANKAYGSVRAGDIVNAYRIRITKN